MIKHIKITRLALQRSMYDSNTIYSIPINQLVRSHLNCRAVDETHVAMLVNQLNRGANLGPITCRPSGNTFEICCGQHRVEAHKRIGRLNIESYIKAMTDSDFMADSIRENINRKSMTTVELWDNAKNLYQMGKSTKDIAEILGTTVATVRDYICCGYFLSDDVKKKIDKRGIAISLCKITKLHQQPVYDRIAAQPKATIASSQMIIDEYIKNHHGSQQKCSIKDVPITSTMLPIPTQLLPSNTQIQTPLIITPVAVPNIYPQNQKYTVPQVSAIKEIYTLPRVPVVQQQQIYTPQRIPTIKQPIPTPQETHNNQQQIYIPPQLPNNRNNTVAYNAITINNCIFSLTNDNLTLLSQAIENIPQLWDLHQFIFNKLPKGN